MNYNGILQSLVDKMEGRNPSSWEEIVYEFDLDVSKDSLRKSFGGRFGGYEVYKFLTNCKNEEETEFFKKVSEVKNEAYRERIRLQDARREINKYQKEYARQENLVQCLKDSIQKIPELKLSFLPGEKYSIGDKGSIASILISDIHDGILIDNTINYYDKNVVEERMSQLGDKVLDICALHKVETLNVELCGDLIAGAIHTSIRVEQEEDLISAIVHVSEVLSTFIARLSGVVQEVNVYCVCGNHARVKSRLSDNVNRENYERLIFEYIKLRVPDVSVYQNGWEDFLKYEIEGRKIAIVHGDKDTIDNIRNHCCNLFGEVVDEVHMGHIHHFNIKDDNGTMIVVNGSVMSTDSYALQNRQIVKPYQIMRIYGEHDCTYRIVLD